MILTIRYLSFLCCYFLLLLCHCSGCFCCTVAATLHAPRGTFVRWGCIRCLPKISCGENLLWDAHAKGCIGKKPCLIFVTVSPTFCVIAPFSKLSKCMAATILSKALFSRGQANFLCLCLLPSLDQGNIWCLLDCLWEQRYTSDVKRNMLRQNPYGRDSPRLLSTSCSPSSSAWFDCAGPLVLFRANGKVDLEEKEWPYQQDNPIKCLSLSKSFATNSNVEIRHKIMLMLFEANILLVDCRSSSIELSAISGQWSVVSCDVRSFKWIRWKPWWFRSSKRADWRSLRLPKH